MLASGDGVGCSVLGELDVEKVFWLSAEYAARHLRRFVAPQKGPANSSEVGVHYSGIFAHVTRNCPHGQSSDKLLRVAVPSQLLASLHAWRLSRRFKNVSKLWRCCSTPTARTTRRTTHTYYHLRENNYSFDALQTNCFGINIKL